MPLRFFSTDKRGGLFKRKDLSGFIPESVVRSDIERHGYQLVGGQSTSSSSAPVPDQSIPPSAAPDHQIPASSAPPPPPHNNSHQRRLSSSSYGAADDSGDGYSRNGSYKRYSNDYSKDYSKDYTNDYSKDYTREYSHENSGFSFDDSWASRPDGASGASGDDRSSVHRRRRSASASSSTSSHFSFNRIAPRNKSSKSVVSGSTQADHSSVASNPYEYKTTIADSLAHRESRSASGGASGGDQRTASGGAGRRKRWSTTSSASNSSFHSTNSRHPSPTIAEFARQNASPASQTAAAATKIRVKPPQAKRSMDFPQPPSPLSPTEHSFGPVRPSRSPSSYKSNGKTPLAQSQATDQTTSNNNSAEGSMTKQSSASVPYNGRLAPKADRSERSDRDRNNRSHDRSDRDRDRSERSSWHKQPPAHSRNYSSGTIHSVHSPALTDVPPVPLADSSSSSGSSLGLRRFLKKFRSTKDGSEASSALLKKYSHPGRLLGTGASGSVSLVTSRHDNVVYAVKKFRPRQAPQESVQDYRTKVEVEFKIGQQLNHENVIHTIELITDMPTRKMISANPTSEPDYYIVMEYCAYDFFTLVMSGLMTAPEVACYFKQLVLGVQFLHSIGLAHRDLKLDNCVVNQYGQLKIIDFGSAVWFRGTQSQVQYAKGIVGSDPYLAPEVFEYVDVGYDPRLADVWSVAIIYCCMVLRRFPWKIPKQSDTSYRSFSQGHTPSDAPSSDSDSDYSGGDNPYGAQRLLRLLPQEMRRLVKKMLTIDPERRYLISDVADYPELAKIDHCHNLNAREYFIPNNHRHHLVAEDDVKKG